MPHLLELPREIRDQIIELSISHSARPPSCPAEALASGQYASPTDMDGWLSNKCLKVFGTAEPILYPTANSHLAPSVNPIGLLETCAQIRAETLDAIARLPRDFDADVMLVDEQYLITTWTYVPPYAPGVKWLRKLVKKECDQVTFKVRSFGVWKGNIVPGCTPTEVEATFAQFDNLEDDPEVQEALMETRRTANGFSLSSMGNGQIAPGKALCAFSLLFERFLRGGASGLSFATPDGDEPIEVNSANLVFMSPQGIPSNRLLQNVSAHNAPEERAFRPEKADWMLPPSKIMVTLLDWFKSLGSLQQDQPKPKHLGTLLNRVDRVEFAVDDKLAHRFCRVVEVQSQSITWMHLEDGDSGM
jgi:hypothetical protein